MDINKKFQDMIEKRKQEQEKAKLALVKREKDARLIECFMNIHQLEKTGLVNAFVLSFYEKKRQELGAEKVEFLKKRAAEYIQILKSTGKIYEHISWFRFVMNHGR